MTARDATTQSDPTDEVASDEAVTPDAVEDETPAEAGATPAKAGATPAKAGATPAKAGAEPAEAEAEAEPPAGRQRGRRRRHAADDDDDTPPKPRRATAGAATSGRRRRRWPLVALVLVAALFAGAMVALWSATRPDPIAGLGSSQQAAIDAASQAAVNLQTFRRASFDEDFANALASLTPDYGQQQFADRKDALQKQLTAGKRDASATVQSAGLVSSTATQAVVLVVTTTVQTADDGTSTPFVFSRLQLSLQLIDGKWLVSDLKSVGLS